MSFPVTVFAKAYCALTLQGEAAITAWTKLPPLPNDVHHFSCSFERRYGSSCARRHSLSDVAGRVVILAVVADIRVPVGFPAQQPLFALKHAPENTAELLDALDVGVFLDL